MARPTADVCDIDTFASSGACYKRFDKHQRHAIRVYLKVIELAALGGTDYTAELGPSGALNLAAAAYNTLTAEQREIALLTILEDNAISAGSAEDTQDIEDEIACLKNFGPDALARMELLLDCLLGRHAAIPQADL